MTYRGIFEYEYPTKHKPPVSIDVHLHGDCVKGKIIEWEYKPLEQEPTTKNDLGVDCVSRAEVLKLMQDNWHTHNGDWAMQESMDDIRALPSVTPQEPKTGHWFIKNERYYKCTKCGAEYDTWYHELKYKNYCPNCGSDNREVEE